MKLLIILLIIINYVYGAKELQSSQNQEAINLIQQVFGETTSAPCDSGYIGCKNFTSGEDSLYYVDTINFFQPKSNIVYIESDFSAFVNITQISISQYYRVGSNLFNSLNKLNYLKSIFIDTHEAEISETISIPSSVKIIRFNNLGAKLVASFFNSNVEFLTVIDPLPGYSIASTLNMDNARLIDLEIPLTFSSSFPSNLNRLKALKSLYINVNNENGTDVNPTANGFQFPTFGEFMSLEELYFDFTYENVSNIQYFKFPKSINNIKSLKSLYIFKKGFVLDKTIGFIDVSHNKKGFLIDIEEAGDLLNSCEGRPCLVLPQNSELVTFDLDYNVSNIDFSNITGIDIQYNNVNQELPNDTIDFSSIQYLDIEKSNFIGKIPDSYCQLQLSSTIIKFNKLTEVPSCFICIGYQAADNIVPNSFTNFDENTEASCSNFYVNPSYTKLADAQGDIIYLEGKDMGYSVTIKPTLDYKFINANTKLGIVIPKGSGVGPFDYNITFANNPSNVFEFSFGYKKPTPLSYYITASKALAINGSSFSSDDSKNSVSINSQTYTSKFTSPSSLVLDSNPTSGSSFNVIVTVDDQQSDSVTFMVLLNSIYINASEKLNLTGGEVELSGSFVVSDIQSVSVSINYIQCVVKSVSPSSIKITYPSVKVGGSYIYEMIIGGNYYSSSIQYKNIERPIPIDNSSSDEQISSAFKFNFNILFILIITLSYILIL